METRRIGGQLATTMVTRFLSFGGMLFFSILVARALQPEGKGVFSSMMSAVTIAATVGAFGLGKAVVYFINRDDVPRGVVPWSVLRFLPVMLVVGIGALLLFGPNIDTTVASKGNVYILGTLVLVNMIIGTMFISHFRGIRNITTANVATILQVGVVASFAAAGYAFGVIDVNTTLAAVACSWLLCWSFLAVVGSKKEQLRPSRHAGDGVLKAMLKYGLTFQIFGIVWTLHVRLDVLLLEGLQGATAAGYYSTGLNLAQFLWRFSTPFTFVLVPYMAATKVRKNSLEFVAVASRMVLPVLVVAALAVAVLAGPIVHLLYGEAFLPSAKVMQIVLPGVVAAAIYQILNGFLLANDRLWPLVWMGAASLALNVLLNLALIPQYHETGAAIASAVSYTSTAVLIIAYLARSERCHPLKFLVPRRDDLALIKRALSRQTAEDIGPDDAGEDS